MKLLTTIFLSCFTLLLLAQEFEDLKVPVIPAANVFGYEANVIDRPQSPKTFASQLFGAVSSNNVTPGLAMEITPFFMKKRYDYTLENYLNEQNFCKKLASSISLSFATSQTDTFVYGNLMPGTGISGGFRMLLVGGKYPDELSQNMEKLKALTNKTPGIIASLRSSWPTIPKIHIKDLNKLIDQKANTGNPKDDALLAEGLKKMLKDEFNPIDSFYVSQLDDYLANYVKSFSSDIVGYVKNISNNLNPSARTGHMLEFAGAASGVFQNNKYSGTAFGRAQLWLTYSYRWAVKGGKNDVNIDAMTIGRVTFNNIAAGVDQAHYLDFGGKLQAKIRRFYISMEGVYRYATADVGADSRSTYRLTGNIEYQINNVIGAFVTFGRNFDGNSVNYDDKSDGSVLSVAGLNIGLGGAKQ